MNDVQKQLVRLGSVEALASQIGDDAAAQALYELTQQAPSEIQGSWPLVIAWARMQAAYEAAEVIGDTKAMLDSTKAQAALLKGLYD